MLHDSKRSLARPVEFEFMPLDEWHAFNDRLRARVQQSGLDVRTMIPGELVLVDGRHLSVMSLAQLCHLSDPDHWVALIDHHLESLTAHVGALPEPFSMIDLRVQLLPDNQSDREVLRLLGARPFAEGVVQTLAVRLADSVRTVPTIEIAELGWDLEESWDDAWSQTRAFERPDSGNYVDSSEAELIHLYSEHPFGASFVSYLDDVVEIDEEHGALVSMPIRHSVLVHPICDATVLAAANEMIPITRQVNFSGQGPVSAHLYWWRDGSLTWIPTYLAPDGMEFYPPRELCELIVGFGGAHG
jgi:hypothetical protein